MPVELSVEVSANRVETVDVELPMAEVAETITVTSESPLLDVRASFEAAAETELEHIPSARMFGTFQELLGGVKPLSVDIPESGKLLRLAGVLPPAEVAVELEVKARRP